MTTREFIPVRVAVLTVSDTRTLETDTSGATAVERLTTAGHEVVRRKIVRDDREVNGAAGIPALLVDYAFDGATLGAAPEIAKLPGFAAKLCYGRAYESGYSTRSGVTGPRDTDMLGVSMLAYETLDARVDLQYQRGFNIMDNIPGPNVKTTLGDIEEYGTYQQQMAQYGGAVKRRDLELGAAGSRYSAMMSDNMADAYRTTSYLDAGGTIASGASSIFAKYAPVKSPSQMSMVNQGWGYVPTYG